MDDTYRAIKARLMDVNDAVYDNNGYSVDVAGNTGLRNIVDNATLDLADAILDHCFSIIYEIN